MQKLMCRTVYAGDRLEDREALACLSRRLPLEFQTTRYSTSDEEWAQVEKHMRVCLSASGDLQDTTMVNPSEPLVSEAAFRVMDHEGFNAAMALRDILSGFAVHQGERGELIALLLMTLARDQVVHNAVARGRDRQRSRVVPVTKFLQCLFRSGPGHDILSSLPSVVKEDSEDATIELSDVFAGAMLHFNHFVKMNEPDMLDRKYLWRLMSRGAAVLCAPNEKGVDALCQFTYHSRKLRKENLGVILFQFTNDACYDSTVKSELYPLMDPFALGIFDDPDTTVPIIRIVLALAGKTPSLQTIERIPGETGKFTSYDIWCSGLDTKFY
ncbi:hypothetical protein EWM64_g5908 [Hericium alpestre]|uniref:Uncharacterized protein n=1 Tax=Hericium alpestre TaxID=135208 RepID=A0A4Y9ZV40_9AGAM|nr:hypothetical protein EWM64_g5908 [Hericium alpestre]